MLLRYKKRTWFPILGEDEGRLRFALEALAQIRIFDLDAGQQIVLRQMKKAHLENELHQTY